MTCPRTQPVAPRPGFGPTLFLTDRGGRTQLPRVLAPVGSLKSAAPACPPTPALEVLRRGCCLAHGGSPAGACWLCKPAVHDTDSSHSVSTSKAPLSQRGLGPPGGL